MTVPSTEKHEEYRQSRSKLPHPDFARWHFDLDALLTPFIPPPPWHWLPRPVSHFLGYRGGKPPPALGNLVIAFWSLIGVFCGVLVVAEVTMHVPAFQDHHAPIIVASFGAAAVLEFSAIESPFAQPRCAILSQVLAAIIGVAISKLFALNPRAASLPHLGGALACACTTALMVLTNTVHPPAGATALLAVTQSGDVGWWLVPIVLLGAVLMLAVALVVNNLQRRFPVYWWTAQPLSRERKREGDVESGGGGDKEGERRGAEKGRGSEDGFSEGRGAQIVVQEGKVFVADNVWVSAEEMEVLERISERM